MNAMKNALTHAAISRRADEARCRREIEAMGKRDTPKGIVLAVMADLHARAAAVYEDALHVLETTTKTEDNQLGAGE